MASGNRLIATVRAPLGAALLGWAVLACPAAASAAAPCPECGCDAQRPHDQVWLVSTRHLGGCVCARLSGAPCVEQYDRCSGWRRADASQLVAAGGPRTRTLLFVHGNRIDDDSARQEGSDVYRAVTRQLADQRPLRLVIWSWPSDREIFGPRRDARLKQQRTGAEAHYLAQFVDRLHEQELVCLVAYSFGARVCSGALQLLAGGEVGGAALAERNHPQRRPTRAVLMAAAIDCDWLWPGHRHGLAVSQVESLLLVTNRCDRVLDRYPALACDGRGAEALGSTGLSPGRLGADDAAKLEQLDVCCQVGRSHQFDRYLALPSLMARIAARLQDGS